MKLPKLVLSLICLFSLGGCIDVQMDFDLRQEQLDASILQRTIDDEFAPRPNEKCEEQGGTLTTLPKGDTSCHHTTPFSLDDWLQQGRVSFTDIGDRQKTQSMNVSVEEIDTDTLRLTMDVNAFVTEIHQQYFPPDMPPVFKESFVQKAKENVGEDGFHISFIGEQVESADGQLSADGKKVTFFVPLSDIVEPEKKTSPDRYTAVIRTRPIPEGLTAPVTFNDPETRAFINAELAPYLPAGWQAVVVATEISEQDVTLASHYILNGQPHKFTLRDERKPKAALLKLHRQMVDDGLGWQKARITLMPDGSLKLEPLS